ncbi:MAG: alpha/beta hydrolase [Candidatus Binatia bacterium]
MQNLEIAAIRAMLAQLPMGPSLVEMRETYDAFGALFPTPSDVTLRAEQAHGVAAEWTSTPDASRERVILYLHGGGYAIGSLLSHRHLVAQLGRTAGAQTLALDYRLAPEHPFPAAVDDALAGYRFLLEAGFAASCIAIAGDSAGGGLTVAALVAAREAGLPQPACGVCISPWVDLEVSGASMTTKATEDPIVQREPLLQMAASYLGGAHARSPFAAPLHADLRNLAPLLIQVGSAEALLDDAVRLAAAAGAQEVDARLEVWPEMIHVWHFFHPVLGEGRRALNTAGAYIRDRMEE